MYVCKQGKCICLDYPDFFLRSCQTGRVYKVVDDMFAFFTDVAYRLQTLPVQLSVCSVSGSNEYCAVEHLVNDLHSQGSNEKAE